jgi:voltage-gated potassium channel
VPFLTVLAVAIWVIFVCEFLFRFVIAPSKPDYLRQNWLSLLALVLPALRVFRAARVIKVLRFSRAARGLTLARVLAAFNRGLHSLQRAFGRYGFGYVALLTLFVTLLGAVGIFAFERRDAGEGQLDSFGDALWFSAMLMTTSGSDYWPRSVEGRILCFLLAIYAFAIFGYVTATIASLLLMQQHPTADDGGVGNELDRLRHEIAALRKELSRRRNTSGDG